MFELGVEVMARKKTALQGRSTGKLRFDCCYASALCRLCMGGHHYPMVGPYKITLSKPSLRSRRSNYHAAGSLLPACCRGRVPRFSGRVTMEQPKEAHEQSCRRRWLSLGDEEGTCHTRAMCDAIPLSALCFLLQTEAMVGSRQLQDIYFAILHGRRAATGYRIPPLMGSSSGVFGRILGQTVQIRYISSRCAAAHADSLCFRPYFCYYLLIPTEHAVNGSLRDTAHNDSLYFSPCFCYYLLIPTEHPVNR